MSLSDQARAARILSESFARQSAGGDPTAGLILSGIADAYADAADIMEITEREEARQTAAGHACSIDHATLRQPTCPLCKAPRIVK